MSGDAELQAAFAGLLNKRLNADVAHDRASGAGRRGALAREFAELSFTGALLAEDRGGLGFGAGGVTGMFVEAGRALLPLQLDDLMVTVPSIANALDPADPLVEAVHSGEIVTLGRAAGTDLWSEPWESVSFDADGAGTARGLVAADADIAGGLLTAGRLGGDPVLALISMPQPYVVASAAAGVDPCRSLFTLELDAAPARILLRGAEATDWWARVRVIHLLATVAETVGIMYRCVDVATEYAKARRQFDRTIGSFQAVKHLLAGAWRETYALDCLLQTAAAAVDADASDAARWVRSAALVSASRGRRVVEDTLQAQGAIAFTAEHSHHLYLKRALALESSLGDRAPLLARVGEEIVASVRGERI